MILFNKLIRIDLILLVCLFSIFLIRNAKRVDVILGVSAALFVMSVINYVKHFKLYKKFY